MDANQTIINIGKKIKLIRKNKNLTQLDLASMVNIEDSSLRRIENGRTNPTVKTLLKLANALEVDIKDFF